MPACLRTQIAEQIRCAIWFGLVPPGQRLPSQRELSQRLGVSTKTIADAFRELQQLGLVEARSGQGMIVAPGLPAGGDVGALPGLANLQGMRHAAAAYRAGLQGEAEERARRAGGFIPQVARDGGTGPLRRERLWVGARFRQAVRQALRAGLTLEGVEELFRAAVEWEVRPR